MYAQYVIPRGITKINVPKYVQNQEPEAMQKSYSETIKNVEFMRINENMNITENENFTEKPLMNITENENTENPEKHNLTENITNPKTVDTRVTPEKGESNIISQEDPLQDTLTQKLMEINRDQYQNFGKLSEVKEGNVEEHIKIR